jgi:hypothetical protein
LLDENIGLLSWLFGIILKGDISRPYLIDSDLGFEENWKNIQKQIGISKRRPKTKKAIKIVLKEDVIRQARMYHEQRSERSQAIDERLRAPIAKDPDLWFRNPAKYDLRGVDLGSVKRKRKRRKR